MPAPRLALMTPVVLAVAVLAGACQVYTPQAAPARGNSTSINSRTNPPTAVATGLSVMAGEAQPSQLVIAVAGPLAAAQLRQLVTATTRPEEALAAVVANPARE